MPRQLLREGLARLLENPPDGLPGAVVVGETDEIGQALELAAETRPDVVMCRGPQWGFEPETTRQRTLDCVARKGVVAID